VEEEYLSDAFSGQKPSMLVHTKTLWIHAKENAGVFVSHQVILDA
jgi:hypothetical protein